MSRGWESRWHRLEGGAGGARSGHGAAILGQEVPPLSLALSLSFLFHQVYLVAGQGGEGRLVPNIVRLDFCSRENA